MEAGDVTSGSGGTLEGDEQLIVPTVGTEGCHGVEPILEELALAGGIGFGSELVDAVLDLIGEGAGFIGSHLDWNVLLGVCLLHSPRGAGEVKGRSGAQCIQPLTVS